LQNVKFKSQTIVVPAVCPKMKNKLKWTFHISKLSFMAQHYLFVRSEWREQHLEQSTHPSFIQLG